MEKSYPIKEEKQTVTVKCDNCGGNMVFDPETQKLKCPHCDSVKDFEKSTAVKEIDILSAFTGEKWDNDSSVYRCENCGAVVVLPPNQTATICPYCETSHVVKSTELAGLKPNALYPFTVTIEKAVEKAKKWAKSKLFAPRKFKNNLSEEAVRGVYQPAFTFDSQTYSTYNARIGKRHTRVVGSGKNRRTQTYIVWRHVSGELNEFFNDVMVNADKSFSQKALNKLAPFNDSTIKEYSSEYLTGYVARRSDKEIEGCWDEAKGIMDVAIRSHILSRYNYDVVDYCNVSTTHSNVTYKYVLLPIYILNFKFRKKLYSINVNGNSGKVYGKTPISALRVLLAVLLGIAAVLIIGYLIYK